MILLIICSTILLLGQRIIAQEEFGVQYRSTQIPADCEARSQIGDRMSIAYNCSSIEPRSDSSVTSHFPTKRNRFEVPLGEGTFDSYLEQGLLDMCVDEVREITIPAELDYRSKLKKKHLFNQDVAVACSVRCLGFVDRNHYHHQHLLNEFEVIDEDGNGSLNEKEIESYFRDVRNQAVPHNFWEHEDRDGDKEVSFHEFSGPKGLHGGISEKHMHGDPENIVKMTRTVDARLFKQAQKISHRAHGKHHRSRGHAFNKDEL